LGNERVGSPATMAKIAKALEVAIEDLIK